MRRFNSPYLLAICFLFSNAEALGFDVLEDEKATINREYTAASRRLKETLNYVHGNGLVTKRFGRIGQPETWSTTTEQIEFALNGKDKKLVVKQANEDNLTYCFSTQLSFRTKRTVLSDQPILNFFAPGPDERTELQIDTKLLYFVHAPIRVFDRLAASAENSTTRLTAIQKGDVDGRPMMRLTYNTTWTTKANANMAGFVTITVSPDDWMIHEFTMGPASNPSGRWGRISYSKDEHGKLFPKVVTLGSPSLITTCEFRNFHIGPCTVSTQLAQIGVSGKLRPPPLRGARLAVVDSGCAPGGDAGLETA